ncbi:ABC transporter ATP-binding protein [Staphylococcus lugdunensis]|uniref:ABC transporter ATP-binding protein n=1 Tax=Staphylococcus lugdunensis TaxID=28035 RepID=UPI001F4D07F1|nr:ABC transporter ATP-binding protein [Staphylococcus lugdunensis]MCH8677422.1 ABC transporter ATP-binding protein [Staphylococcus lugdunensis]
MIKFDNVSFTYAEATHPALKQLSLEIKQGEVAIFCGKSGSGKSTIAKLINGLIPKVQTGDIEGDIYLNQQSMAELSMYEISTMVGSVFQNPKTQFYNVDTTSELAFNLENQGVSPATIMQKIEQTMDYFELTHLLQRNIFELSGGEKQMIACASVLISKPEIVVLDEPSSNLDMYSIKKLQQMIRYLKQQGTTVIIIDHRLDYALDLADNIYYIDSGQLQQCFTVNDFRALEQQQYEIMGLRYQACPVKNDMPHNDNQPSIHIKDFSYGYNKWRQTKQLNIADFSIPEHEMIAIIGDNGSGKSTFARCFCGLAKGFKGSVSWQQCHAKRKQLLKHSYMVFQDVNTQLFTESVDQEMKLLNQDIEETHVNAILKHMNLLAKKEAHPRSLSGGEKQRVAIATALISNKDFIIFDEPTSGLDLYHMKQVAQNIQTVHAQGKRVFVITHDYALILELCSYVMHFAAGQVIDHYPLDHAGHDKLASYFQVL